MSCVDSDNINRTNLIPTISHAGQFLISNVCLSGIAVYLFDFAGCGQSDGSTLSLCYFETENLTFLIAQLWRTFAIPKVVLWGRSMDASIVFFVAIQTLLRSL
jgi:pimeloyl-ACP methyl ester carboxylesterase